MKFVFLSLCAALVLSGCTGGGSSGGSSNTVSGTLMDSAVGGVYYRTETMSGMTDDAGTYKCQSGESVEFYLKGDNGKEIHVGAVSCSTVTSPIEIVTQNQFTIYSPLSNLSVNQSASVVMMLRLLQSLDNDGNPANGITVAAAEVSILADNLESDYTLNVALKSMFDSNTFDSRMGAVMTAIGRQLVSEVDAVAHFNASRGVCEGDACEENPGEENPPEEPEEPTEQSADCLEGLSYATSVFGGGQLTYGSQHVIEADGSAQTNLGFIDQVKMTVVLNADHSAQVYRSKNNSNSVWYVFANAGWTTNVAGEITVEDVQFADETVDLKLGARQDVGGGVMARYGSALSFGTMSSEFDRMFSSRSSCSAPTNTEPVSQVP